MIHPLSTGALGAALVGAVVLAAPSRAQEQRSGARISSWITTVTTERDAAQPGSRTVTTGSVPPPAPIPAPSLAGRSHALDGIASFYWQSQMTASGERFDKTAMTAAHRTLPFGSKVRVTNLANGRSVVVRINDRGPFKPGRVIDISWAAAGEIDMRSKGLTKVRLQVVELAAEKPAASRAARR